MIYGFKASMSLLWTVVLPGMIVAVLPFVFLAAGVEPWFYFLVCASRERRAKERVERREERETLSIQPYVALGLVVLPAYWCLVPRERIRNGQEGHGGQEARERYARAVETKKF